MHLDLRNAIAEVIVGALEARAEVDGLDALAAALAPEGAILEPASARRLVASGAFTTTTGGRVVVRPELSAAREAARARAARGRAAVECYWAENGPAVSEGPGGGRTPTRAAGATTPHDAGDRLSIALEQAAYLFNAGLYFEVHEILEAAWQRLEGEPRLFVQGLIQIAVALHHLQDGNHAGARSLFRAGRQKLAPYVPEHRGVATEELLRAIEPWERSAEAEVAVCDLPAPVLRVR